MESFGEMLRRHREGAGLSQNALARRAGVNPGSVNRLESGEREPSTRDMVVALADALGISRLAKDRLLVAAGHLPTAFDHLDPADPILLLVADILADPALPEEERRDFATQIKLAAKRWRKVDW